MTTYGLVYRLSEPAGWKGRRARVVALAPQRTNWLGRGEINTGETLITVEFDNGDVECVARQSVVPATSRPGRAAIRNGAMTPEQLAERSREYQKRYQAAYRQRGKEAT